MEKANDWKHFENLSFPENPIGFPFIFTPRKINLLQLFNNLIYKWQNISHFTWPQRRDHVMIFIFKVKILKLLRAILKAPIGTILQKLHCTGVKTIAQGSPFESVIPYLMIRKQG